MLTYKIHLFRHGLTQGNLEGRYIGVTDLPLCERGRQELSLLRETCEYPAVDRVYVSPLLRARESAALLFPEHTAETVDKLREFDFGEFEGKTMAELDRDARFAAWIAAPPTEAAPGGDSGVALQRRATEALAYIFGQMMEQKLTSVAVVTHGGVMMNLLAQMGLPERSAVHWNTGCGRGYTLLLSAQMWMRDHKFEVYARAPYDPAGDAARNQTEI